MLYEVITEFLKQNGIKEIEAKEKDFDTDLVITSYSIHYTKLYESGDYFASTPANSNSAGSICFLLDKSTYCKLASEIDPVNCK